MPIDNGRPNEISSALRRGKWRDIIIEGAIGSRSGICRVFGLDFALVSFLLGACRRMILKKTLLYVLPTGLVDPLNCPFCHPQHLPDLSRDLTVLSATYR